MKKRILTVGGILVVAGAAGGLGWYYYQNHVQDPAGTETVYVSTVSSITGNASGIMNRYAGVVEPQETVEVSLDSGRVVKEVKVKAGEEVKQGQLLFEYDLSSIQEDLQEAKLDLERLKNEALSLTDQVATLEKEKREASQDNQLSYTIEIETNKMNLKKNEYEQKSKEAEIQKLQNATGNTEVRSEIDGIIQKIDTSKMTTDDEDLIDDSLSGDMYSDSDGGNSNAFITILSTGAYRIKGKVNEQNASAIIPGEPVIIRSRVDEAQIWRGTMGSIDRENANSEGNNSMSYFGMTDMGDSQTSSSSYPFYVELDSSDGLMLGQHVYIENDNGQEDKKAGLWLSDFYIVDADSENPYVWAADEKNKLEKRSITLGQYDESLGEYEIADGLSLKDCIAYPAENLQEGMSTSTNISAQQGMEDEESENGVDMETDFDDMENLDDMEDLEYTEDMGDIDDFGDMESFGDLEDLDLAGDDFSEDDGFSEDDDFSDDEAGLEDASEELE